MLNIQNEWLSLKLISLAGGLYVTLTGPTTLFEQRDWQSNFAKERWRSDAKKHFQASNNELEIEAKKKNIFDEGYEGYDQSLRMTNSLYNKMTNVLNRWPLNISFCL